MNSREVLARLADLNVDFRYLDQLIVNLFKGAKVLVGDKWMTFGIFQNRLVLNDEEGIPNEYSNLDCIKTIQWPQVIEQPTVSNLTLSQKIAAAQKQEAKSNKTHNEGLEIKGQTKIREG